MSKPLNFGPALSAIAMASVIAGCAAPQATSFGGRAGKSNIGLATRALAALNANDFATAVNLAERSVENSPRDAGFRSLLGNAYFGSGRFASAESAYRDSLALVPNQPQVVLKLALVQIGQGRNAAALASLATARGMLDPADYGLAVALAGQPQDAVQVLESAARLNGADARLRQNLALAHALSGDWTAARTIAAQDLSADLVDARVQQWMTFAKPARASDQVAALTGVTPVAADPGQPTRLALNATPTRTAEVAPVPAPQQVAQYAPQPQPVAIQAPMPQFEQVSAAPAPSPIANAPTSAPAPEPQPAAKVIAAAAAAAPDAPSGFAAMAAFTHNSQLKKQAKAPRAFVRRASLPRRMGNSTSVVQLGAYGSPQRVAAAWSAAARRYAMLRAYSPMSARFNSAHGTVYRLSVRGFGNADQAKNLCVSLRRSGGSCFVRTVAGDVPVRIASR